MALYCCGNTISNALRFMNPAGRHRLGPAFSAHLSTTVMVARHQKAPFLLLLTLVARVAAYKHHAKLTNEELSVPVDAILRIHMVLQCLVWRSYSCWACLWGCRGVVGMSRYR